MNAQRLRGYTLLHLLAAIPLTLVVGTIAAQITDRVLRSQSAATCQMANDLESARLIGELGAACLKANSISIADTSDGTKLVLRELKEESTYIVSNSSGETRSETSTVQHDGKSWPFRNCRITPTKEVLEEREILWLTFDCEYLTARPTWDHERYSVALIIGEGVAE